MQPNSNSFQMQRPQALHIDKSADQAGLLLQRQLPSSQVPRYNPHPPESPPQLKKKVQEIGSPISPVKRKFGKMKEPTAVEKIDFSKYNIEELLLTTGIEFRNPDKVLGGWLPLEAYDDREFDTRIPSAWLHYVSGVGPKDGVGAQGLWKDKDGLCYWRKLRVLKFLPKTERYEGFWENTREKCRLPRIYILFDEEDPRIFSRRFKAAYQKRINADALIKYNYYVENMPKHQIPEIDVNQQNRVLAMTQNTKALRGKSSADTTTLINEVNADFAKTMNNIIFDKHCSEKGNNLITGKLELPPAKEKKPSPYYGMIKIPPYSLAKKFSKFTFNTLQYKDEVIRAQQEIRKECNEVAQKDIYNLSITKALTVDEFKQYQTSSITQTSYYLKETWLNKIKEIIKTQFGDSADAQSSDKIKPWLSLTETSKDAYEAGKLKKFLTQQRFVMENTILNMTTKSVHRFVECICSFLPISCTVMDSSNVQNVYYTAEQIKALGAPKPKIPLFQITLELDENNEPVFSHSADDVVHSILKTFEHGLSALQEIGQLEQKLLPHLFKSNQKSYLKVPMKPETMPVTPDPNNKRLLPDENAWIYEAYVQLRSTINESLDPLTAYLETFKKFKPEYQLDVVAYLKTMDDEENPPEADNLRKDVIFHRKEALRLAQEIPDQIVVSMFNIKCDSIKNLLVSKHNLIAEKEIDLIAKQAKVGANKTMEAFSKINDRINANVNNIEELSAVREYMLQVPQEIEKLEGEIKLGMQTYKILESFQHKFGEGETEDWDRQWKLYGSPNETYSVVKNCKDRLDKEELKMVNKMKQEQVDFETKVAETAQKVVQFVQYQDMNSFEEVAAQARIVQTEISKAVEDSKIFNNRETLTGNDETNYDNISQMFKDFEPFFLLWTNTELWKKSHKSWLYDEFDKIDPAFLEETVENCDKIMNKVIRQLKDKDVPGIKKIAETIKESVLDFKQYAPMTIALRNEGMKPRHWEQISGKVGFQVKPYPGFTLQHVLDMELQKWSQDTVDIGERAGKEYNIECTLAKMKADWEIIEFRLKPFKNSGTYTTLGFDDAQAVLDEHMTLAQTLQFSPFKKPFEDEIIEWNAQLLCVSNSMEEWLKCQVQWAYLQPIFDSNDIMKQLPGEAKKFKAVDKRWREIQLFTKTVPKVLQTCLRENGTLAETFRSMNNMLDAVNRGLNDYLESKRSVFARFYFLANTDLLEILSQTKEVENVRPHLRKVFENMTDLRFEIDKTITYMMSAEKEEIKLTSALDPKDKKVEDWMGEVENMMFETMRDVLLFSIKDYSAMPRPEWIKKHPGQCVLNGSQVHWTTELETAAKNEGLKGISEYHTYLQNQLNDTVGLVRQKLNKLQSITLGALIVIDVHAMDVVGTLKNDRIDDIAAFEWISQLRYYWEKDNCYVKCIQTNFPYGYEYLGNTQRLVITPLTDKCYMTLMGALNLNLGGAPAGPAGTGKTESTKDLAKALAKQCVVFNCSDGMDYIMIGKFFKGLAAAGAWCCFDEFNRINIEVLSVIAQQLLQLFGAKGRGEKEIDFEESHIFMKPTFCVFITMNPGYAGRTELPDNLKALFRPMAMMVPNYALIGQIMLYSFGYITAAKLALKMVTTFTLCSEQLSSQDHYDYGMRAVRSVINAAGLLKRATPDMNEDQLLLRALRDVNVPKFLKDDLPLFENIIQDLFPGVAKPNINYGNLEVQIVKSCQFWKVQPERAFVEKIIQLFDTCQVRHGLMLVGPTGGGKTYNYRVLAHAQTALRGQEQYQATHVHVLNPKAITMDQLYGYNEPASNEWMDGVAAKLVAESAKDPTPDKHWVMFDGPVDALWIESMNTVLDDNKKLCLNSGQIIPLSEMMTMMFEVEDLSVASPATVSRCGMIYMEPGAIGIPPLIKSWMESCPPSFKLKKTFTPSLEKMFEKYCDPLLVFMRKNCLEPVATVNNNIVQSLFRILDCFFVPYWDTELKKCTVEEVDDLENMLEAMFIFASVWSIGCTTTGEGRLKFNNKVKDVMGKDSKFKFPPTGTVYDYAFNKETKEWQYWTETVQAFTIDGKATYSEIIVPTFDSIRMKYVKKLLLTNGKHCLCPGPTGTGKTVNVSNLLNLDMPEEFQSIPLTFSAQTSANQVQDALDEKFEKRRKGIFGPPPGKKFVIFIDDLNMPKKEVYGAQPPIELLRQWMDHKGWYDRIDKERPFRKIEDIIIISAMGPPGGGRSEVTQRLQRHFNIITYTNLGPESVEMIFNKIVNKFLGVFSDDVRSCVNKLVDATQVVYNGVEDKLKPIPAKSHYTFNLRDMSKIFQGLCSASSKFIITKLDLVRLWVHENQRVFADRMINESDKQVLLVLLIEQSKKHFDFQQSQIFESDRIIFGDFHMGIDGDNRPYQIITDHVNMLKKIEEYLEDYNGQSKQPMKLIMFLDACDHVARICRILRQPQGNALLLGVGGSGRQSLSKIATFMNSYKLFQIEVIKGYNMKDWRENLKTCLLGAGVEAKVTTFLFVDTQIISEAQLEDINTVLNSGDVPQLYKAEDMEPIMSVGKIECQRRQLTMNKMNMFQQYLNRVKANVHMVIAMSPLGETFRSRLRQFPSLVNCCTIDWFTNWPAEALINVARGSVTDPDADMNLGTDEEPCIEMFKIIHQSVEVKVEEFKESMRRICYVTPTSYLELLSTYKKILKYKRTEVGKARSRLSRGLEVLKLAAVEVDQLQKQLELNAPILAKTQIEVEATKKVIAENTKEAEAVKAVVMVEEAEAAAQAAEVKAVKDNADFELGKALPALAIAVKKVNEIDVNSFYELRGMAKPSPSCVACFKLCCMLMLQGKKPKKPDAAKAESDPEGFFDLSKSELLNNPNGFLKNMINYDKDNIPDILIQRIKPLMAEEVMSEKRVENASKALVAVRIWIQAMITYHETLKIVNPMREVARTMSEKLEIVMSALAEKQAKVKLINENLAKLNAEGARLEAQAANLNAEMERCSKQLVRAEKMIGGLEGEKNRWTETVARLTIQQDLLVGDCLVAAGMVSYAGPFTAIFREALESLWREAIRKQGIKLTNKVSMRQVIGNDVLIRQWSIAGLPSDNLSVENGIIMFESRRWPLMIDPQTQANKFVKNLGRTLTGGIQFECFKPSHSTLIRDLEYAVQFGKWVLLENVSENLDPALEPILLMQLTKQGSGFTLKIGDKIVPYNPTFRFFMTTTLPNPHYTPETSVKVTILNFAITQAGLEEQMLNLLITLEMPELQDKKNQIVEDNAKSAKISYEIEDKILAQLSDNTVAQLLETDTMIEILADAKQVGDEIAVRRAESEITEKEIDRIRESFRSVAYRAAILFFAIVDMCNIDPMYQYSLQWFQRLFSSSVKDSEQCEDIPQRIINLNDYQTISLYNNICRSLFERHKLLFSLLLCTKILFGDNKIDPNEFRYLLSGPSGSIEPISNPADWLDDLEWVQVHKQLYFMDNSLPVFKGILDYFVNFHKKFKKIFDSPDPQDEPMPGEWDKKLNSFQKIVVLKTIRADKVSIALQNYIIEQIGKQYVTPPTFRLDACYRDSSSVTPLIFVLSSGSDPIASFLKLVDEMEMGNRKQMISLGQGQAKKAETMIAQGMNRGEWILLQNCHLSVSWLPKLEAIVEGLNEQINPGFRLWMTSMPSEKFPVSVLQNSVKMTMEPPSGLRQNLLQNYEQLTNQQLNDCKKPGEYKKLLFCLSFFHAIVQDRRKFGAIGWNIPYAFTFEDFDVCRRQLKIFLDEYEVTPYKVLNFLFSEINYGGRVTDDKDVRLIKSILSRFVQADCQQVGFTLSESGIYKTIPEGSKEDYLSYIQNLPLNPRPEAFGLHENAEIITNQNETRVILENIQSIQPRASTGKGKSREDQIGDIAISVQEKMPEVYDLDEISIKFPTDYNESMNTVLCQEILKYNKLIARIAEMLKNIKKALVGEVVMSEELEKMGNSLFDNLVPLDWAAVGFLSLKPLASWVNELLERIDFLNKWINGREKTPPAFWISGFFFPQAFFTATLQNFARKKIIAIDKLSFEFKIWDEVTVAECTTKPEDGAFCYGMFMEGARWNNTTHLLDDSKAKQLYTEMPIVWFLPKEDRKVPDGGFYYCPIYKVLSRAGTLSTTGHSTNYCLLMEVPSNKDQDYWVRAGVALFLSLRY